MKGDGNGLRMGYWRHLGQQHIGSDDDSYGRAKERFGRQTLLVVGSV